MLHSGESKAVAISRRTGDSAPSDCRDGDGTRSTQVMRTGGPPIPSKPMAAVEAEMAGGEMAAQTEAVEGAAVGAGAEAVEG